MAKKIPYENFGFKTLKKITDFFDVLSDVSLDASCFAIHVL